jgi:tetratricopeptide (TPR) repeat protein
MRKNAGLWAGLGVLILASGGLAHAQETNAATLETASPLSSNAVPTGNPHQVLQESRLLAASSNVTAGSTEAGVRKADYRALLETALEQKRVGQNSGAERMLVRLLESEAPEDVQKTALLTLAVMAHERQELGKAQQIYAQYVKQYPNDEEAPEVLLRQGLLYRQMGAPVMALSKFYAVMSSALNLKVDRLDHYQRLVLQSQSEIAETYYLQGKYEEAVEYFGRLLKLTSPDLDRAKIVYKLVRSLSFRERHNEVIAQAEMFLNRFPDSASASEVRFLMAESLKKLGRNREAMEQVLALLQWQQKNAAHDPQSWTYWRQRTGNEIANQLYQEGDYIDALQIYESLSNLSNTPEWQLPALYQVGLVYERLRQSQKALEVYDRMLQQRPKATNAAGPSVLAVLDMARWRKGFLSWQEHADASNQQLHSSTDPGSEPASP